MGVTNYATRVVNGWGVVVFHARPENLLYDVKELCYLSMKSENKIGLSWQFFFAIMGVSTYVGFKHGMK